MQAGLSWFILAAMLPLTGTHPSEIEINHSSYADSAVAASGRGRYTEADVEVGPIWGQKEAERVCPRAAEALGGNWTGQWRTTRPGVMSVCGVRRVQPDILIEVRAGPIWNQKHAERKCPKAARSVGGTWTGQWWTTEPGVMSVCQVSQGPQRRRRTLALEVGPLWGQSDADNICPRVARAVDGKWTGHWWTTRPGEMSVCQIEK